MPNSNSALVVFCGLYSINHTMLGQLMSLIEEKKKKTKLIDDNWKFIRTLRRLYINFINTK